MAHPEASLAYLRANIDQLKRLERLLANAYLRIDILLANPGRDRSAALLAAMVTDAYEAVHRQLDEADHLLPEEAPACRATKERLLSLALAVAVACDCGILDFPETPGEVEALLTPSRLEQALRIIAGNAADEAWKPREASDQARREIRAAIHAAEIRMHGREPKPAAAGVQRESPPVNANPASQLSKQDQALAVLIKNPALTNKEVAAAVGVNPKTLSKKSWTRFRHARKAIQSGREETSRGAKDGDGNLEAWEG